jgi:2',3'-cyclic-nucleotide 2'-phosphodiesterase (5'-nucleotidase family)
MLMLASCAPKHYQLVSVERSRIIVDSRYDQQPDPQVAAFFAPYKHVNDSVMAPLMGRVAHNMHAQRPESDLSNLVSDIMIWAAKDYNESPVLGIYNMGGIRADLIKGDVTYEDILSIAPFENKICFLTLTGENLMELFRQIAKRGGEGVSHGVELVITADGNLVSAKLNGQEIDPRAEYRITTIDYLAQGNDGLAVFQKCTKLNAPRESRNNSRFIIMNYFKEQAGKHAPVSARVEGRIKVIK